LHAVMLAVCARVHWDFLVAVIGLMQKLPASLPLETMVAARLVPANYVAWRVFPLGRPTGRSRHPLVLQGNACEKAVFASADSPSPCEDEGPVRLELTDRSADGEATHCDELDSDIPEAAPTRRRPAEDPHPVILGGFHGSVEGVADTSHYTTARTELPPQLFHVGRRVQAYKDED